MDSNLRTVLFWVQDILPWVFLILSGILFLKLLNLQNKNHLEEREVWMAERKDLLNRCMTKEWQTYQVVSLSEEGSTSSEEVVGGMSDEEELRRSGIALGNGVGVGEVFVDLEDDMRELGILKD